MKVSIIIPIYNVEKYIERCVVSLFKQDFEDIEYIFVNDCTPDNSVEILQKVIKKHPLRQPYIKIIHHQENKGSGAARNTGIKNATGEYTIQIDSDDWCETDMISSLYQKAIDTNADIVACDYFYNYENNQVYHQQNYSVDKESNLAKLLWQGVSPVIWNKLVKRSLYVDNNLYPTTKINIAEDKWLTVRLFTLAEKIVYVPQAFYHYRQDNSDSLTTQKSNKSIQDLAFFSKTTKAFLQQHNLFEQYKNEFYVGNIGSVCLFLPKTDYSYKQAMREISPESDSLTAIWQCRYLGIAGKIGYSFSVLGLNFITRWLFKIHFEFILRYQWINNIARFIKIL
ncbi:MAG: glycosyltransferase family 2 protein [Flavobacteriaceae bacterium]|nr:glycosyltransferase family 2 protein [Flavobacteriaceae bacterium]